MRQTGNTLCTWDIICKLNVFGSPEKTKRKQDQNTTKRTTEDAFFLARSSDDRKGRNFSFGKKTCATVRGRNMN